jgi:hypothetical protein
MYQHFGQAGLKVLNNDDLSRTVMTLVMMMMI